MFYFRNTKLRLLGILFSSIIVSATPAAAGSVMIELNKLEANNLACRAFLVIENQTERAFDQLKIDVVMFDTDGIVARRLAVQVAPLSAGKTSLKVFDIKELPCDRIGRMLLNDVVACSDATGVLENCTALVVPSTRATVAFIK